MKSEDDLYAAINKIAGQLLLFQDFVKDFVEDYSNEEVLQLADYFDNYPNGVHEYELIADHLRVVVAFRNICKLAKEHMGETGEKFYCVSCCGACKSEENHYSIAESNISHLSKIEDEIDQLSIKQLKQELLKYRLKDEKH